MKKETFKEELLNFVNTQLLQDSSIKVKGETRIFEEGMINSMKIIDLMAFIESKLNIRISETQISMEYFESVDAIVNEFLKTKDAKKLKQTI